MTESELKQRRKEYREYLNSPKARIEKFLDQLDDERERQESLESEYASDGTRINSGYPRQRRAFHRNDFRIKT